MASLSLAFDILAKDRASKVFKDVGNAAEDAGDKSGKFASALKTGVVGAAKVAAAGLAAAATGVIAFGAASIRAASEGEQSLGAIESVFGKASQAVKKFSDDSAFRLGLSRNEYRELASVVGSQLKNMGQSQDEAAVSSDKLISLGADLAATFGGPVSEAIGAVGSLLRGERDPIERYGVAIKDADIKARLAADGNDKLTGAALKTATAQATLKLLSEQTAGSLGAFGRESNTLAGTQERLRARFSDVKEEVGNRLLPIATRFAQYLLKEGVPAFERLIRKVEENKESFRTFAIGVGVALAGIVQGTLLFLQGTLTALAGVTDAYAQLGKFVFAQARGILQAMEASLGWLPGFDVKFKAAGIILDVYEKTALTKIGSVSDGMRSGAKAAGVAADAVGGLRGQIQALTPKKVEVDANVKGENDVRSLGSRIRELADKTVTITTVQRTIVEGQRAVGRGVSERALGGPVTAGRPYLVGERGPELIVPSRSGNVLTADQTSRALSDDGGVGAKLDRIEAALRALPRGYMLGQRQLAGA